MARLEHTHSECGEFPHRCPQVLHTLYWRKGLMISELSDILGPTPQTITKWMERYGIDRRSPTARKSSGPAHFRTRSDGYEVWNTKVRGQQHTVRVSRLAAIAWFGFDAVTGNYVHHGAGEEGSTTKWDNRESNFELLSPSEHSSEHMRERAHLMVTDEHGNITGWSRGTDTTKEVK